jgi:hypothetical protein
MIYLASPYSHENPGIMAGRFEVTRQFVAYALKRDVPLFSPIVYCHQFVQYEMGTSANDWHFFNRHMMMACDAIWVLKLEGWQTSRGVRQEVEFFQARGIEAEFKEFAPWHK